MYIRGFRSAPDTAAGRNPIMLLNPCGEVWFQSAPDTEAGRNHAIEHCCRGQAM